MKRAMMLVLMVGCSSPKLDRALDGTEPDGDCVVQTRLTMRCRTEERLGVLKIYETVCSWGIEQVEVCP